MNRILLLIFLVIVLAVSAQAATIAYVVNNVTDTTTGVTNSPVNDKQWIRFFADQMGYTVKIITDDSAQAITTPSAYDGYFLSATMTAVTSFANLDTTSRGVVICDQLMYDDFRVAAGQTGTINLYNSGLQGTQLNRVDSTIEITKYMSDKIWFAHTGVAYYYAYTGVAHGATILYNPSNKNWDDFDTSFCYAIDTGDSLTTGVAAGRRVVALSHYNLLTSNTDLGWCHPYELMGNICGWAWGDTANAYITDYNCYSQDRQTIPEVAQSWWEFGAYTPITSSGNRIYANGRFGYDESYQGGGFLDFKNWSGKTNPGFEPDSLVWTYPFSGFGADAAPYANDTVSIIANGSSTMTMDSTTADHVTRYQYRYMGSAMGIIVRSGVGADTTKKGDTCTISKVSATQAMSAVPFTKTAAGFWNGDSLTPPYNMRLRINDWYSGFDFWVKLYQILPQTDWIAPRVSAGEGGNPYPPGTKTYANRTFIKSGNTDSTRWSAINLAAGVDYAEAALDSFRFNATTFPPDGSVTVRFNIPGSVFNDPDYNGFVWKAFDLAGLNGTDSTDMELIPQSVQSTRTSQYNVQKFEMYLSSASPQTLGVEDTTYTLTGEWGSFANGFNYNAVVNTGDGVIAIDSVVDDQSWLFMSNTSGSTPLSVLHVIDTTGLAVGSDTATVLVYASGADNTPLTYYVIYVLTSPPVETPAATVEKRTGLRMQ